MTNFSCDAHLLKWEPSLFRDLAIDQQCLTRGSGAATSGLTVSADGRFQSSHVRAGHVLHLAGNDQGVDGYYEVVSVEAESALLAAIVGTGPEDWVPPPEAAGLDFSVVTFDPQHEEARGALLARFGLDADASDPTADLADWLFQMQALRRASAALVLAMLYRGQAAGDARAGGLASKADHYARLYEQEASKARLVLDRNADGLPDDVRSDASFRLRRD